MTTSRRRPPTSSSFGGTACRLTVEVDTHLVGLHPLAEFLAAVAEAGFAARSEELWLGPGDECPVIVGVRS